MRLTDSTCSRCGRRLYEDEDGLCKYCIRDMARSKMQVKQ
jgi:ribosomal protein L37E